MIQKEIPDPTLISLMSNLMSSFWTDSLIQTLTPWTDSLNLGRDEKMNWLCQWFADWERSESWPWQSEFLIEWIMNLAWKSQRITDSLNMKEAKLTCVGKSQSLISWMSMNDSLNRVSLACNGKKRLSGSDTDSSNKSKVNICIGVKSHWLVDKLTRSESSGWVHCFQDGKDCWKSGVNLCNDGKKQTLIHLIHEFQLCPQEPVIRALICSRDRKIRRTVEWFAEGEGTESLELVHLNGFQIRLVGFVNVLKKKLQMYSVNLHKILKLRVCLGV